MDAFRKFPFLVISAFIALIYSGFMLFMDFRVNNYFIETKCAILGKKIAETSGRYRALVKLQYSVNQMSYTSVVRLGHPQYSNLGQLNDLSFNTELLNQYSLNSTVRCWYDPSYPQIIAVEKNDYLNDFILIVMCILFLIVLYLLSGKTKASNAKLAFKKIPSGDLFELKENRFTIECIYLGSAPITPDMLPKRYQKASWFLKNILVRKINETGRFVTLKPFYAYCLAILSLIIIYFLYVNPS